MWFFYKKNFQTTNCSEMYISFAIFHVRSVKTRHPLKCFSWPLTSNYFRRVHEIHGSFYTFILMIKWKLGQTSSWFEILSQPKLLMFWNNNHTHNYCNETYICSTKFETVPDRIWELSKPTFNEFFNYLRLKFLILCKV